MLKEKTIRISIVQIKSIMTPTPRRSNLLAPSHCFGQLCTLVYIWADIHGHPQMALLSRSNGWGRCCDVIRARAIIPHITHGWRFSGCHARLTATTRWRASFDRHLTGRLNQRTGQMLVYQLCVRISTQVRFWSSKSRQCCCTRTSCFYWNQLLYVFICVKLVCAYKLLMVIKKCCFG